MVQVRVADVNDNPPYFLNPQPQVTVVEEDDRHLPATIAKVEAVDKDWMDHHGLLYTVRGDGVDGHPHDDAFFSINSLTGELIQLRALDRDPPRGKEVWRVRVQVRDGQALWSRQAMDQLLAAKSNNQADNHIEGEKLNEDAGEKSSSPQQNLEIHTKRRRRRNKNSNDKLNDGYSVEGAIKEHLSLSDGKRRHAEAAQLPEQQQQTADMKEEAWIRREVMQTKSNGIQRGANLSARIRINNVQDNHQDIDRTGVTKAGAATRTAAGHHDRENDNIIGQSFTNNPYSDQLLHKSEYSNINGALLMKEQDSVVEQKSDELKLGRHYNQGDKPSRPEAQRLVISTSQLAHTARSYFNMLSNTYTINDQYSHSESSHHGQKASIKSEKSTSSIRYETVLTTEQKKAPNSRNVFRPKSKERETRDITAAEESAATFLRKFEDLTPHLSGHETNVNAYKDSRRTHRISSNSRTNLRNRSQMEETKESLSAALRTPLSLVTSRGRRSTGEQHYELGSFSTDSGCDDPGSSSSSKAEPTGRRLDGSSVQVVAGSRVHVAETVVMVVVKDINDNSPVFPNATMFGEVQENGPIDLSVAVIAAWDADDVSEGANARITYSIAKNVVYEPTGEAIFTVEPDTGLVRTAICCLDRETTPEYEIQVVAVDGGGLKGTGVVVVRLVDVNDNCPRLEHSLWDLETDETRGQGPPDNSTLLHLSVLDSDTSNYFFYRVVEASGWGWEHFGVRTVGAEGQLFARQTLDYEDETHRRGFRFMVQVTDKGRGGWRDPRHMDAAWVTVRLRDLNDNPPHFHRLHAHVTVKEDAAPGTLLAALPAHDPDMGGEEGVEYRVEGAWGALSVDSEGGVSLRRALDREAPDGAIGVAKIVGVDHGRPPLTATATLTITVTDVNDSPPVLLPPTLFHVTEGAAPTLLGALTATDHDVWALGHGPPFNFSLAPTNPAHVLAHISLKFDPHLDSGRGGAEVWTVGPVDREEHRQLLVGVVVADAGGVSATHTVTVIVDDINDNPMKPGAKTVYLWKTQGGGSDAPLGRVFVDDPDDWDLGDKTFRWLGSPHPLFSLNTNTGDLFASSQVREARYELQFAVSDQLWGQRDVEANVTVAVRILTPDALAHAAPITLTPTTPAHLAKGWTPEQGGGGVGQVIQGVQRVVGEAAHTVEVVSVSTHLDPTHLDPTHLDPNHLDPTHLDPAYQHDTPQETADRQSPEASVWISIRDRKGSFMDPIKLQGLLALHSQQMEAATNLTVVIKSPTAWSDGVPLGFRDDPALRAGPLDPSSAAYRASTTLPLQVVDINSTSLVTPRLSHAHSCHAHEYETCTASSCLNGGRCVATSTGNRCVCPGGSWGARCKVLARTFTGDGWAWVRPLPPCFPTTISLRLLTRRPHALVLYSGPLATVPRHPDDPPTPMLALQVWRGRPQLLLEGGAEALKLEVNRTVNDGDWHTIHLHLHAHGASLMVDLCGRQQDSSDDSQCGARGTWLSPEPLKRWFALGPLQVGGLAHAPPNPAHHGWREAPTPRPLDGCLSHLTLDRQLVDLGEPAYSCGSKGGCHFQTAACPGGCGHRGLCVGGINHPVCECDPGWAGPNCATPTVPATFGPSSFVKLALSFMPAPQMVMVQLRLRTRSTGHGLLLHLAAHQHSRALTIQLRDGVVCASAAGAARAACVEGRPVGDGAWHTVRAEHHGPNLVVSVDDGDFWRRNETLVSLEMPEREGSVSQPPVSQLEDGVTLGGFPDFVGMSLASVVDDLQDSCIDDVRVSGRQLQLPPAVNGSRWGQVTSWQGLEPGCTAPDACLNATCDAPLSCVSTWGTATCSCGPGEQVVGSACEDVDECAWRPCLHGGSCYNLRPGFQCVCGPGHTGDHCQWTEVATAGHPLAAPVAIAALTVSLLLLVVVGVVVSLRLRRQRVPRGSGGRQSEEQGLRAKAKHEEMEVLTRLGDERHQALLQGLQHGPPPSLTQCTGGGVVSVSAGVAVSVGAGALAGRGVGGSDPLPAKDDLRAYAYEGDGSSAGSLSSALSGLREEQCDTENFKLLVPEFLEVVDLLKNLPDAAKSPSLASKLDDHRRGNANPPLARRTAGQSGSLCSNGDKIPAAVRRNAGLSPEDTQPANDQVLKSTSQEGEGMTMC
ncbi:putative neural-cadherin 2 isoform X1 [Procambarus clarkii]|uniref:putative neural-cadherin 2 isoform X1 n=1 Tax=Procambarus clarkii TaxID=6728 RepID=UPI003743F722